MKKLINISELSKMLNLINIKTQKPSNHIIRYWEKEFPIIRPVFIKNRRYFTEKQVNIIKLIKHLLKNKGMTIKGVKKILKLKINNLDDYDLYSLKASYDKESIRIKSKNILDKIKEIKKHGKKNSY